MNEVNKFYSTFNSETNKRDHQISELGKETFRTIGVMVSDGRGGHSGGEIINSPTTLKDYDDLFIKELLKLDPPYLIDDFLTFHFDEYQNKIDSEPTLFIKHMKYVILDRIKRTNRDAFIQLLSEWISKNEKIVTRDNSNNQSNLFTAHEISLISKKLDDLLLRISRLELGQEITYEDIQDEILELKELTTVLSKKTWFDVLKGKLLSIGLGKLTDQGIDLITSIFSSEKSLNP